MLKKAILAAFGTFLFLIPFKIQTVLAETPIFLQGNFNPYTTFFLTLPDIALAILLLLIGIDMFQKPKKTENWPFWIVVMSGGAFIIVSTISYLWAENTSAVLAESARLTMGMLIPAGLITSSYFKKNREKLINIFILSMVIQGAIGILQFSVQHSLGLHALGESHIAASEPGIAKIDFLNKKIVRAYGTFPHPNIFAAFILVTLLLTTYIQKLKLKWIIRILLAIALLLTFSRSVWLIATIAGIAYITINGKKYKRNAITIFAASIILLGTLAAWPLIRERMDISKDSSMQERLEGISASIRMIRTKPQGVGLGNYTENLQEFTEKKLAPWEYQPVHNTLLLTGAETGVQGMMVLIAFLALLCISTIRKKNWHGTIFMAIMICIMLTDHYLLTVPQGQQLFGILTAFTLTANRE